MLVTFSAGIKIYIRHTENTELRRSTMEQSHLLAFYR